MRKTINVYEVNGDVATLKIEQNGKTKLSVVIDAEDLEKVKPFHWNSMPSGYAVSFSRAWKGKVTLMHRLIMDTPNGLEVDHINHDKGDNRKANLRNVTKEGNARNRKDAKNIRCDNRYSDPIYRVYFNVAGSFRHFGHYRTLAEAIVRRDEVKAKLMYEKHVEPSRDGKHQVEPLTLSGERYINWHKATKKWAVNIKVDGKPKHRGLFATVAEAKAARDNILGGRNDKGDSTNTETEGKEYKV